MLRRHYIAVAVICSCSQCAADEKLFGAHELISLVQPCMPHGWNVFVKVDEVVLERCERIEIYNSIAFPPSNHEEEIRRRLRKVKLSITLRVEQPMKQEEYESIARKNQAALEKVRKDFPFSKLMGDSRFWREHPQYQYRELPSFDLGHHSVVMACEPEAVVFVGRRIVRPAGGKYLWMFKNTEVEEECQGIVGKLATLWRTYRPDPNQAQ